MRTSLNLPEEEKKLKAFFRNIGLSKFWCKKTTTIWYNNLPQKCQSFSRGQDGTYQASGQGKFRVSKLTWMNLLTLVCKRERSVFQYKEPNGHLFHRDFFRETNRFLKATMLEEPQFLLFHVEFECLVKKSMVFLISRAPRIVLQSTKSTVFHLNTPLQVY